MDVGSCQVCPSIASGSCLEIRIYELRFFDVRRGWDDGLNETGASRVQIQFYKGFPLRMRLLVGSLKWPSCGVGPVAW